MIEYEYKRRYITNEGLKEYVTTTRRPRGMKKVVLRQDEREKIIQVVTDYFNAHPSLPTLSMILEELLPQVPLLKKWYLGKLLRELKKTRQSLPCNPILDSIPEEKCVVVDSVSSA